MKRPCLNILKKTASLALALLIAGVSVPAPSFASEATGFELQRSNERVLDEQLTLVQQQLRGAEDGVLLAENYYVYTPGSFLQPVISYGNDIRGAASYARVLEIEDERGLKVLAGTNGDFFTVENGISQGIVVRDGIVRSSEDSSWECIAFDAEGNARIGRMELNISLFDVDKGRLLNNLSFNKSMEKSSGLMLFSSDYGYSNAAKGDTYNVWIHIDEGEAAVGGTIYGTIEEVFDSDEDHSLDEEHLLLSVYTDTAYQSILPVLRSLEVGDSIDLNFSVAEGWEDVRQAVGGGARLVKDGEAESFEETGKAPRTAMGVTGDGKTILYTADGRNSAYSMGLSYAQLAQRMIDLGAVDAINLDGGGSTQLHLVWPGYDRDNIINKPTENRRCANYILFAGTKQEPSEAARLYLYRSDDYILAGSAVTLNVRAADKDLNPTELPGELSYGFDEECGYVEEDRFISYPGVDKVMELTVSCGGLSAAADISIIGTPDAISILGSNGKPVGSVVRLEPGETLQLGASAEYKGLPIRADQGSFSWTVDGGIGQITPAAMSEGSVSPKIIFTASEELSTRGTITVSAGACSASLDVIIDKTAPELDWSVEYTALSAEIWDEIDGSISPARINVRIDGEKADFSYDQESGQLSAELPDDALLHHIVIEAGDEGGNWRRAGIEYEAAGFSCGSIFEDMPEDHWATGYVEYMNRMGILNGKEKGDVLIYEPDKSMSRQEFAAVMIRMLGVDTSLYEEREFPWIDTDTISSWAVPSVKAAAALGIMEGKGSGDMLRFDPLGQITKQEAYTVIGRIWKDDRFGLDDLSAYSDAKDVAYWALPFVQSLAARKIIEGKDGRLDPLVHINRAEVAKIIFECW